MRCLILPLVVITFASSPKAQAEPVSGSKHFAADAVELGWKYVQKGDYGTALRRFQMAILHDPDFAPAYFGAGYVLSKEGKFDEAIKCYRETLKRDTLYVYSLANLGNALLQEGQIPEAVRMLDKALEIDPTCGEAHLIYTSYYAYKQDWKSAEQSVNKAIKYGTKLDPELRDILEKHGVKIAEN